LEYDIKMVLIEVMMMIMWFNGGIL